MSLIRRVEIEGYRTFAKLTVDGLRRINLFVGRNNTGKTALLEAIEGVVSAESPMVLYRPSIERGEVRPYRSAALGGGYAIDIRRWFHGHGLAGSTISIKAVRGGEDDLSFDCRVEAVPDDPAPIPPFSRGGFRLLQKRSHQDRLVALPVRPDGGLGLPPEDLIREQGLRLKQPVHFVGTALGRATELELLWSKVQLTPSEQEVEASLRLVEPSVRRIGFQGRGSDVGCSVLLDGETEPIPLGSLGEGTTRMLGLALGLANTAGGYLFIDEIDSGLHYSVMADLWRLVIATAKRLDVQVFATTHSYDCVSGLGALIDADASIGDDVALHRLERELDHTTPYDASEIAAAARHHMELR
jgi:energy-coupling factor transporter ATP-binding protein EcfA2